MDRESVLTGLRAGWRAAGRYRGALLGSVMDDAARRHATDQMVFVSTTGGQQTLTMAELTERAHRLARSLRAHGIGPGDAVAVQLPDIAEGAVAHRAAFALGATLVPVPSIYGERELEFIVRDSRARCLIATARWRSLDLTTALAKLAAAPGMELVAAVGDTVPDGCVSWADLVSGPPAPPLPPSGVSPADVAVVIYTSGSTSEPKGVRHSHETLLYEMGQAYPASRLTGARWLSVLTSGHMAGFLALTRQLVYGGYTVAMDAWDPAVALEAIDRFGLTAGTLPPYHLTTLLEAIGARGGPRHGMADCLVGSTSVQAPLIIAAEAADIHAYRCYGSSEHPTISTGFAGDPLAARAGTDGWLMPGIEVRIVDDDERDLPAGAEGNVLSRGPDLFLGYTDPAATDAAITADGYYRTGDVGILDDGFLTITGRRKDIIIRGGENLSPKEIEDVMITHPAVLEVAVVGRPDPRYGERPWAFAITRDGGTLTLAEIRRHFAAAGVARQKTPEGVTIVDDFPRTAAGKIRKNELRAMLGSGVAAYERG